MSDTQRVSKAINAVCVSVCVCVCVCVILSVCSHDG